MVASSAAVVAAPEQAGVSAAVRGQVQRASDAQPVGVQVVSGQPIYLADRISSGPASGMQIMLLDQTTFTIGPDSFVKIDEFVYDPTTNVGKVTASLGKGVFRFVSGKIAQENPSNMTVKLPVATIGIRGTMVFGRSDENSAVVGLAGAGPDNNTGDKPAGIDVITPQGTAEIRRPGFGVIIERGKPLVIGRLPKPMVDSIYDNVAPRELTNALSVPGGNNIVQAAAQVNVRTANTTAQQSTYSSTPTMATFQAGQAGQQTSNNTSQQAVTGNSGSNGSGSSSGLPSFNDPTNFAGLGSPNSPFASLLNGFNFNTLTSIGDLNGIGSGFGTFSQSGVPVYNILGFTGRGLPPVIGSYTVMASIGFDSQFISLTFSSINVNGAGISANNASITGNLPYNGLSAAAPAVVTASGACGNATCEGIAVFNNAGGTIAKNMFHELIFTQGSTVPAVGLGVTSR